MRALQLQRPLRQVPLQPDSRRPKERQPPHPLLLTFPEFLFTYKIKDIFLKLLFYFEADEGTIFYFAKDPTLDYIRIILGWIWSQPKFQQENSFCNKGFKSTETNLGSRYNFTLKFI